MLRFLMAIALLGVAVAAQTPATPQAPPSPAELIVPAGFKASVFASDLQGVRLMTVSPEGTLLVARRPRSEVVALRESTGDKAGRATNDVIRARPSRRTRHRTGRCALHLGRQQGIHLSSYV
jgi:glucose/arabinose dehydrogenase